jgi:transposase
MGLYTAFDLHSNNAYLGIIDENGKRLFKKKLANEREMIKTILLPFKAAIEGIVVESTYNWYLRQEVALVIVPNDRGESLGNLLLR